MLRAPDGTDILIDGGPRAAGPTVVAYLQQEGVDDIEVMVVSHPHEDHIGGLINVLQSAIAVEARCVWPTGYHGHVQRLRGCGAGKWSDTHACCRGTRFHVGTDVGFCAEAEHEGKGVLYAEGHTVVVEYDTREVAGGDEFFMFGGFQAKNREFIDCLRTGEQPGSHFGDAVKTMEVAEKILAQSLLRGD